ncbi:MAG: TRAP transporter large permease subunit, partial [Gammaproteobacteria bacterium]|nr:TRAP transporter large permease subunit [Gammaproteobacteria bacterium]
MAEYASLIMFAAVFFCLLLGYPVALTLGGTALIAAGIGVMTNTFEPTFLFATPNRLFGIITNQTLIAVPLFVLMGVILEQSKIAERLLSTMSKPFGSMPGGLGIAVTLVGMLMAASTGIVGATVVTMSLMSLPSMLKAN